MKDKNNLQAIRTSAGFSIFFTCVAGAALFWGEGLYQVSVFIFMTLLFQISVFFEISKKIKSKEDESKSIKA